MATRRSERDGVGQRVRRERGQQDVVVAGDAQEADAFRLELTHRLREAFARRQRHDVGVRPQRVLNSTHALVRERGSRRVIDRGEDQRRRLPVIGRRAGDAT